MVYLDLISFIGLNKQEWDEGTKLIHIWNIEKAQMIYANLIVT